MKRCKVSNIVFLLISLFLSLSSCGTGCAYSPYHSDLFYNVIGDRLINNAVTIGIGNSVYNEDNSLIAGYDYRTYSPYYKRILIEIYVDDNDSPVDIIEIPMNEYESYKYHVPDTSRSLNKNEYSVLYEFNVLDYQFNNKIRFGIKFYFSSYDSSHSDSLEWVMKYLDFEGRVEKNKFIVDYYKEGRILS